MLPYKTMVPDSLSLLAPIRNETSRVQRVENIIPPLVFIEGGEVNSSQVLNPHMGRETATIVSQITDHPNLPVEVVGEVHTRHHAIGQQAACQSTTNHFQGGPNQTFGSIDIRINTN